jgi:hypothetical protein
LFIGPVKAEEQVYDINLPWKYFLRAPDFLAVFPIKAC